MKIQLNKNLTEWKLRSFGPKVLLVADADSGQIIGQEPCTECTRKILKYGLNIHEDTKIG